MPKLISLSSADKNKANPKDHEISVGDATKMVAKFDTRIRKLIKREYKDPKDPQKGFEDTKSIWFHREVLEELFKQADCNGVRIYLGNHISEMIGELDNEKNNDKTCTILVGTKEIPNQDDPDKPINEDLISDDNKMAISTLPSGNEIYDLGSMCPDECDGTKL
ncbi:MAG: hypothetical protein ACQETL_17770 [Bacteroidota bacterium]